MYTDWKAVPIPHRMTQLARDDRGYPIPAIVLVDDHGRPDFKTTDLHKWHRAYKNRTCALCGEPMGRNMAFVGGPKCFKYRFFTDLAMHRDCAEYALKVCPFLAAPNFKYAENIKSEEGVLRIVSSDVSIVRPTKFMLGITKSCKVLQASDGTVLVQAAPWEEVTWWEQGEQIAEPDLALLEEG